MDKNGNFSKKINPDLVYRGQVIQEDITGFRWSGRWYATMELVHQDIDRLISFSTGTLGDKMGGRIELIVQQNNGQELNLGRIYTNRYYLSGHSPYENFKRDQS